MQAQVVRVPIAPMHMINAYLVIGDGGVVIVDAGLPGSAPRFEQALARNGKRFADVRLIVVTHAHVDHAGAAARLRELTGAPILAHRADRPFYTQAEPVRYCPTGPFGRLFKASGVANAAYDGFEADIELTDDDPVSLHRFGVAGTVRYTPGHTSGSLSVHLESRDMLVSDLVSSGILLGGIIRLGSPKRPPFEDDPRLVARQLDALIAAGGERFHVGHGATLTTDRIRRHIRMLERLPHQSASK